MMLTLSHPWAAGRSQVEKMALVAAAALLGSLLLAVSARLQVPFWPVPMTMQTMAVLVIAMTLGARLGCTVVVLYVVEGMLGLPVFANTPERGVGLAYLLGPTGGYLLGFIVAAYIAGRLAEHGFGAGLLRAIMVQMLGTAVILTCGAAWLATLVGIEKAFALGVAPFLLSSLVKIGLGGLLVVAIGRVFGRA
ncbi:MAG: biotin transporter BioY [Ferrovibrio sp.]|uniref:biotin transporter BioY n=1 Tax=Ferrovibrio sp. TaxID=1917215 RepID=UPI00261B5CB5|nr:biotin transporter BioY [Ferrovibrio sp.]MCW0234568.1 biotin transporter BioY [Ferrovibrio sp.]